MEEDENTPISVNIVPVTSTETELQKCNFCLRTCGFSTIMPEDDNSSEVIYHSCCRHINPDHLNSEFFSWSHPQPLPFCKKCLHSAKQLSGLNETFEQIQKRIDSFVNSFTVDFLKQRENPNDDFEPDSYGEAGEVTSLSSQLLEDELNLELQPSEGKDTTAIDDTSTTHIKQEINYIDEFVSSPINNHDDGGEDGFISNNEFEDTLIDAPPVVTSLPQAKKLEGRKRRLKSSVKRNMKLKDVKVNLRRMEYDAKGKLIANEHLLPRRKAAVKAVEMISSWAGKKEVETNADESDRSIESNWIDNDENDNSDMELGQNTDYLRELSDDCKDKNATKLKGKETRTRSRSIKELRKKGSHKFPKEELDSDVEQNEIYNDNSHAKPFECKDCDKKFTRKWKLNVHSRVHSGERPFSCNVCKMTFVDQYYLKKHANVHSKARLFKCAECGKTYKHKRNLTEHIRTHNREALFDCKICKASFLYLRGLKKHFLLRHKKSNWKMYKPAIESRSKERDGNNLKDGSLECAACGKTCASEELLANHTANVHPPEGSEFVCEICNKIFRIPDALRRHMKTHNIQEFPCASCNKVFKSRGGLKEHSVIHYDYAAPELQDKFFSCHICDKVFATKGRLKSHLIIHTDSRPYGPCDVCGKSFRSQHALTEHLRGHQGAKAVDCPVCHKVLSSKSCLNKHMYLHKGEKQFPCPVCGKKYRTRSQLTAHSIYHKGGKAYLCEECGQSFYTGTKLKEHVRVHTGMLYPCEYCDKGFKNTTLLKQHFRTHNKISVEMPEPERDEKPEPVSPDSHEFSYPCTLCDQSFSSESKLMNHNSVHTQDFLESIVGV